MLCAQAADKIMTHTKMKRIKLLTLSTLLIFWASTNAQLLIDINESGYFINNQKIEYPMTENNLRTVFGKQDRNFDGINIIYTYDKLGVRSYKSHETNFINSLYIDFIKGSYKFSPKRIFEGEVKINGFTVTKHLNKDSLINIPNLFFDMDRPIDHGYSAVTFNDIKILFSFDTENNLADIGFSFSAIKNDFGIRSEASSSQFTLEAIEFEYERGEMENGKKIGVWEYYDNPNELSLKYDHNTNAILYLNKNDDEFVIKDGIIWDRSRLDFYPRIIGSNVEFRKSLAKLIDYPIQARSQSISGTVYISFVVDKNSILRELKIESDIGGNCGAAVVKALNLLKYSWTHAIKNDLSYDSKFILPVTFLFGDKKISKLPTGEKTYLPDAYKIPEIKIIALGVPSPIKN
jgi:hypothetical protein